MSEQYVELILQWRANANMDKVRDWLRQRGIGFMEMQSGLLIFGDKRSLEKHVRISLDGITAPAHVPVPQELQSDVTTIMLPGARHLHA
jgi:hypothetical protein